jgi:methyl-accepting chemotaxis protein
MSPNRNQLNHHVITAFISIIVSLITAYFLFGSNYNSLPSIKTVDLGRIHTAEMMLSMRASKLPENESKQWIDKVNKASENLKSTILAVAGNNSLIFVAPAVISGAEDITNSVLVKLGLPVDVPSIEPPRNLVLGGMDSMSNQIDSTQDKANQANQAAKVLDFLTP